VAVQRKRELVEQQRVEGDARKEERAKSVLGAGAKGYAQRKAAKLQEQAQAEKAVMIQARIRGKKERTDPGAEVNVRRARSANDPALQGAAYLEKHRIMPLFEMLSQMLLSEKPEDPKAFLAATLETLRGVKNPTSPKNFFTDADLETLYHMCAIRTRPTLQR